MSKFNQQQPPGEGGLGFSQTDEAGVPDFIEPMLAWRTWLLRKECVLGSTSLTQIKWPSGRVLQAKCADDRPHKAPDENCRCGIYALTYPQQPWSYAAEFSTERWTTLAIVALWGKIIEGPQGWKAEFCYPKLFILCPSTGVPELRYPSPYPEDPLQRRLIGREILYRNWNVPVVFGPSTREGWLDYEVMNKFTEGKYHAAQVLKTLEGEHPADWLMHRAPWLVTGYQEFQLWKESTLVP
jgi:hypothetical protein